MAQSEPDVILFLVGNKKDMEDQREVSLDRVEKFKKDRGIMFHFETSAKTGENIENLFIFASKVLYNSFKDKIEQMVSTTSAFFYLLVRNFIVLSRTDQTTICVENGADAEEGRQKRRQEADTIGRSRR